MQELEQMERLVLIESDWNLKRKVKINMIQAD